MLDICLFVVCFWLQWVFIALCRLSVVTAIRSYSLAAMCRLLIAMISLVVEHGFKAHRLQ